MNNRNKHENTATGITTATGRMNEDDVEVDVDCVVDVEVHNKADVAPESAVIEPSAQAMHTRLLVAPTELDQDPA